VFASEFPDYAALSNPLPMTAKEVQALLSDDEALLLFAAAGDKESYVFAFTRDSFDWKSIPLGGDTLAQKVTAFRRGLDPDMVEDEEYLEAIKVKREMFDLGLANEVYTTLIGPVEPLVKDKRHLLVVPFGPSPHCRSTCWSPSRRGSPRRRSASPSRRRTWRPTATPPG
jgi:hypothetical protein